MRIWSFAVETRTLLPPGDLLNTLTPMLGIGSAALFLLAAAVLLHWGVPAMWFRWLFVSVGLLYMLAAIWLPASMRFVHSLQILADSLV